MKHGRRDVNHQAVVGWYRELGCSVCDCADMALGHPDLLIGSAGVTELSEVKSEDGKLNGAQQTFMAAWRGGAIAVVRTQDDVINHVQRMRKRARVAA